MDYDYSYDEFEDIDDDVPTCLECGRKMVRVKGESLEHFGTPCRERDHYECYYCD